MMVSLQGKLWELGRAVSESNGLPELALCTPDIKSKVWEELLTIPKERGAGPSNEERKVSNENAFMEILISERSNSSSGHLGPEVLDNTIKKLLQCDTFLGTSFRDKSQPALILDDSQIIQFKEHQNFLSVLLALHKPIENEARSQNNFMKPIINPLSQSSGLERGKTDAIHHANFTTVFEEKANSIAGPVEFPPNFAPNTPRQFDERPYKIQESPCWDGKSVDIEDGQNSLQNRLKQTPGSGTVFIQRHVEKQREPKSVNPIQRDSSTKRHSEGQNVENSRSSTLDSDILDSERRRKVEAMICEEALLSLQGLRCSRLRLEKLCEIEQTNPSWINLLLNDNFVNTAKARSNLDLFLESSNNSTFDNIQQAIFRELQNLLLEWTKSAQHTPQCIWKRRNLEGKSQSLEESCQNLRLIEIDAHTKKLQVEIRFVASLMHLLSSFDSSIQGDEETIVLLKKGTEVLQILHEAKQSMFGKDQDIINRFLNEAMKPFHVQIQEWIWTTKEVEPLEEQDFPDFLRKLHSKYLKTGEQLRLHKQLDVQVPDQCVSGFDKLQSQKIHTGQRQSWFHLPETEAQDSDDRESYVNQSLDGQENLLQNSIERELLESYRRISAACARALKQTLPIFHIFQYLQRCFLVVDTEFGPRFIARLSQSLSENRQIGQLEVSQSFALAKMESSDETSFHIQFKARWEGPVLLGQSLATEILDKIHFHAQLDQSASSLLCKGSMEIYEAVSGRIFSLQCLRYYAMQLWHCMMSTKDEKFTEIRKQTAKIRLMIEQFASAFETHILRSLGSQLWPEFVKKIEGFTDLEELRAAHQKYMENCSRLFFLEENQGHIWDCIHAATQSAFNTLNAAQLCWNLTAKRMDNNALESELERDFRSVLETGEEFHGHMISLLKMLHKFEPSQSQAHLLQHLNFNCFYESVA